MRARFSAFTLGRIEFLLETWDPTTRPPGLRLDGERRWVSLSILRTEKGGLFDQEGLVEFVAVFVSGGAPQTMRERSAFRRQNQRWLYVGPDRAIGFSP